MNDTRISMSRRQLSEWPMAHPVLREVVSFACEVWPGPEMFVTCIHRSTDEDVAVEGSGVHATIPHRALDARTRNLGDDYQERSDEVAEKINARFSYDPRRPTLRVAISKPHGTGPHLHIQVHPRTTLREGIQ